MIITKLKIDKIEYNVGSKDIVSKTKPENQEIGDLWFISHDKGIKWEKTSRGAYSFIEDNNEENKWVSNNKGVQSSIANAVWQINVPIDIEGYVLKYKVSSETTYNKFTLTLDGNKIVNNISGNGSEQSYSTTLTAGLHTLDAKYSKDSVDQDPIYDDCAYVILEPVYLSSYEEVVDYVGTKITDENIESNYDLKPIGCDADKVFLSNGSTLDYFVKNLNTFLPDFGDITISLPSQADTLTYNGNEQSPTWLNYNSDTCDIGGTTSSRNAGTYIATFTPKTGYKWADGTRDSKNVSWIINKANGYITLSSTSVSIYKGNSATITVNKSGDGQLAVGTSNGDVIDCSINTNKSEITITGLKNGSGNVTVSCSEGTNYKAISRSISVTVTTDPEKILIVPSQSGTLTYNSSAQTPVWNSNYDSTKMDISGDTSGTNAGTYTVTFTPKSGYEWEDGTTVGKEVSWTIGKANGSISLSETDIEVYNGDTKKVDITVVGDGEIHILQDTALPAYLSIIEEGGIKKFKIESSKIGSIYGQIVCDAGTNYKSSSVDFIVRVVERPLETISLPTQSGTLIYNGSSRTPVWNGYDSTKMTVGGTIFAINAGSYNASFTPKDGYKWSDGTVTEKLVAWTIDKAAGSMTLSTYSVSLNSGSTTVTATRLGDGQINAYSNNTNVATVSVSGTTITITAKSSGTTNVIVSCGVGTNYTAPASKAIDVTVDMISTILAENSPATIKKVAQSGQAANYWSVGDKVPITLNGTVGIKTFSNETYYAYIIGFNHNSSREGNNKIHFKFGKNQNNIDICFTDSNLFSTTTNGFIMNQTNTNQGGWETSHMRRSVCMDFLLAIPAEWRNNVITSCTKYSNNSGGSSLFSGNCTSTQDMIWILSEYEMYGSNYTGSVTKESEYQAQYDYYKNGNSKLSYQYNNTSNQVGCWFRSPIRNFDNGFVKSSNQSTSNSTTNVASNISSGFSPCFIV